MLWWTPFCNKGNGWAKTEMPEQKSEGVKRKKKEKRKKRASEKVTRKLSHGSPCLQQPYFITQRQSLGGNQAYLAILVSPPPPKAIITPQFFTVLCHGENEPQYLSAQCIHKWLGWRTCRCACFCLRFGEAFGGRADHWWAIGYLFQSH